MPVEPVDATNDPPRVGVTWLAAGAAWGVMLSVGALVAFNRGVIGLHSPELLYVSTAYVGTVLVLALLALSLALKWPRAARGALASLAAFVVSSGVAWGVAILIER